VGANAVVDLGPDHDARGSPQSPASSSWSPPRQPLEGLTEAAARPASSDGIVARIDAALPAGRATREAGRRETS
jgi:hypothetical protein